LESFFFFAFCSGSGAASSISRSSSSGGESIPVLAATVLVDLSCLTFSHASRHFTRVSMTSWSLSSEGLKVAAEPFPSREGDIRIAK
jgi:hypothetical protein